MTYLCHLMDVANIICIIAIQRYYVDLQTLLKSQNLVGLLDNQSRRQSLFAL